MKSSPPCSLEFQRGWFEVPREVGEPACVVTGLATISAVTAAITQQASAAGPPHTITVGTQTLDSVQAGFDYLLRHVRRPPRLHRPGRTEDRDRLHLVPGRPGLAPRQGRSCRSKADRATRRSSRTSGTRSCTAHFSPTGTCSPSTTVVPGSRPTSTAPSYRTSPVRPADRSSTHVVASCAKALNHRWKDPNGTYVHASDLFTSAPAANDMAAIIDALGVGKIDLYGDSYGSFFAQTFASRYPGLIRSVVLDSTYETQDLDPWYRSSLDNMPANYDNACSRSPACAQASSTPGMGRHRASLRSGCARHRSPVTCRGRTVSSSRSR